jgi:hypothetical protein
LELKAKFCNYWAILRAYVSSYKVVKGDCNSTKETRSNTIKVLWRLSSFNARTGISVEPLTFRMLHLKASSHERTLCAWQDSNSQRWGTSCLKSTVFTTRPRPTNTIYNLRALLSGWTCGEFAFFLCLIIAYITMMIMMVRTTAPPTENAMITVVDSPVELKVYYKVQI